MAWGDEQDARIAELKKKVETQNQRIVRLSNALLLIAQHGGDVDKELGFSFDDRWCREMARCALEVKVNQKPTPPPGFMLHEGQVLTTPKPEIM